MQLKLRSDSNMARLEMHTGVRSIQACSDPSDPRRQRPQEGVIRLTQNLSELRQQVQKAQVRVRWFSLAADRAL